MTIESLFSGLIICAIGIGMMYSYLYYIRRKLNVNIGVLESVIKKATTANAPASVKFIESVLNAIKFLGLLFVIIGVIAIFNPR